MFGNCPKRPLWPCMMHGVLAKPGQSHSKRHRSGPNHEMSGDLRAETARSRRNVGRRRTKLIKLGPNPSNHATFCRVAGVEGKPQSGCLLPHPRQCLGIARDQYVVVGPGHSHEPFSVNIDPPSFGVPLACPWLPQFRLHEPSEESWARGAALVHAMVFSGFVVSVVPVIFS